MLALCWISEHVKSNHCTTLQQFCSCIGIEFNQQQQWLFLADASVTASTASDPPWLLVVRSNFDGKLLDLCTCTDQWLSFSTCSLVLDQLLQPVLAVMQAHISLWCAKARPVGSRH